LGEKVKPTASFYKCLLLRFMSLRFYTNVQMVGNNFLVRGYENGEKVIF